MGNKRELVDDEYIKRCADDGKECERRLGKKKRLVLVDEDEDDGVLDEDSRRRIEELINRSYYFDRLPDDIVMSIVDRLSLKDATKTCILSRRFHHVFKTSLLHRKNLDFEDSTGCLKFVQRVNHILHIHEGPKVDSLQIAFDAIDAFFWTKTKTMCDDLKFKLNEDFKNWLTFARAKSVQSLEIDFRCSNIMGRLVFYPTFPMFDDWNKLTALSLKMLGVYDADLEHGLKSHLVNLESLFIQDAFHLGRVVVASPKLKKLEIRNCSKIHSIAIDLAPNLECFIYEAYFTRVVIMNFKVVPKLSHVSLERGAALSQSSMAELMKVETLEKLELLGPSPFNRAIFSPQFAMCKVWDKLTSLSMKDIKVVDADIEHLMINLESLYIYNALNLRNFLVKSLKLKRLEIRCCSSIRSIDIDFAPNLEFFCYEGKRTLLGESVVHMRDAPKLSHVSSKKKINVAQNVYFRQLQDIELYFSSEMISL